MTIISFNIRGLGGLTKWIYLREIIIKEGIEMICIPETKVEMINNKNIMLCGGNNNI